MRFLNEGFVRRASASSRRSHGNSTGVLWIRSVTAGLLCFWGGYKLWEMRWASPRMRGTHWWVTCHIRLSWVDMNQQRVPISQHKEPRRCQADQLSPKKTKKITRYYLKENLRQGKTQKKRKVHCTRQSTSWSEGSGSRHYSHRFRGPLFNVISRVKIGSRFNCILGSDFKSYIPSLMPGFFLLSGMYLKEEFQGWQDGKVGNPACQQAWRNQVRVPVSTQKKERTNSCNWSSPCRPPTHTHTSNKYKFKNKNKSFHCLISLQS